MGGLNVSNVHNLQSRPSTHNEPASSLAPGSCPDVLVNKTKPASGRADFFRYVRDNLPPNASTPLPFTAMELLDLHPTVALGSNPWFPEMTCDQRAPFIGDRPQQLTFLLHIWTHIPGRRDAVAPTNKHVTSPVPSSRDKPLLPFRASSPKGPGKAFATIMTPPTSPMQTWSNCGTWRRMCCFTATRTRAGGNLASRNCASSPRTGLLPSPRPFANGGKDAMSTGERPQPAHLASFESQPRPTSPVNARRHRSPSSLGSLC